MAIMTVTTECEQSSIVKALAAGVAEHMLKPFTPDALIEKVDLIGLLPRPSVVGALR